MNAAPDPQKSRVYVGPTVGLAEAGYMTDQLAECGIRAWLRTPDEGLPDAYRLVVESSAAGAAQTLLDTLDDDESGLDPEQRREPARRVKRFGASALTFMLCLRFGGRFFASPYLALPAGLVLALVCFMLLGPDEASTPPVRTE